MATDIRRMSKEELDELNRQGAIWRARNKPAQPVTRFRSRLKTGAKPLPRR